MKNKFIFKDNKVCIYLRNINDYAIIDSNAFDKANSFNGQWSAWYNKHTDSYYVIGSVAKENNKRGIVWLHRFILNIIDSNIHVDHMNNDSLDCTRSNLNIVTNAENHQNMKIHKKKKVGITYLKKNKKWMAQITINMKHIYLGLYDSSDEAQEAYNNARKMYHTYGCNIKGEVI